MILSGVDERTLNARLRQMIEFYQKIPTSEKNDQSLLESWNSIFDIASVTPKTIAKDHCEVCHRPLVLIKKQALVS